MQQRSIPMEALAELLSLQLAHGGQAPLTVTGSSMLPMLREGRDTVYLSCLSDPLKKGDLILYRRDSGSYILHRIVAVPSDTELICCGDNQWQPERIGKAQVLGVVSGFSRNGKHYDTSHGLYRLYVRLWVGIFPVRRYMFALRRKLKKLFRS